MSTITLYGTPLSGHVHRVALLLRMLALPYAWVEASADVRQSAAFRRSTRSARSRSCRMAI